MDKLIANRYLLVSNIGQGGVGPMTIVSLMKNTLLAGKKAIYK